jgi:hypothetical protein
VSGEWQRANDQPRTGHHFPVFLRHRAFAPMSEKRAQPAETELVENALSLDSSFRAKQRRLGDASVP